MPLVDDSSWGRSADNPPSSNGNFDYLNNPLVASKLGLDGRSSRGSIDDYWVQFDSSDLDPYISGSWTQHTLGDAIGDYMQTSQSAFGLGDAYTRFYDNWTNPSAPLMCSDIQAAGYVDGTLGRELFYQAKGYIVTDCYNQFTDNQYAGGFSFAQYKTEIDAGRPVMINLEGQSIVGVGYAEPNTIYIHDTWDDQTHSMAWGGSYSGMAMVAVSIVNLAPSNNSMLIVSNAGNGTGTVTSIPSGINCGNSCTYAFDKTAIVILTAAPTIGNTFTGWSGGGCFGTGTCTVPMSSVQSVTATFSLPDLTMTSTFLKVFSDYDGDGKTDPAKFVSSANALWYLKSSTGTWQGVYMGSGTYLLVGGGDYDGDGMTDPAEFISSTNALWYLKSSTGTWQGLYMGPGSYQMVPGSDFDGDGKTDPAIYVPSANALWYLKSSTGTWQGLYMGPGSYQMVPGSDFDGDGKTDPALFVSGSNTLWYLKSSTGTWQGVYMGPGTVNYVAASDFDGDGKTDPATFVPSTNTLWYLKSTTGTWLGVPMGTGTLTYVSGCDFDGDGKADPTVYNASTQNLSWLNSTTSSWTTVNMGSGTMVFIDMINSTAYYVATTGNDANPGTLSQPWKTIQKAADTMSGGDTVYIRGGTYNQRVNLYNLSNASGPFMTFTNYPGEEVILDGTGIDIQYGEGLFNIHKANYIRVSGLKVQHSNGAGIYVYYSNNIEIDNNRTYDTVKSGVSVWGSTNVVVDGNDIALACNAHPNYPASEENISIASGSSNVEVKNNYVHQAANIPDGYSGGEGINIKDGAHDVRVHNNVVHLDGRTDGKPSNRLAFGLDAWSHETYNVSFYDNVAYNNANGFVIESEAGGTAHDIFVYNNIAYNNTKAGFVIPNWAQNETSLKKNIQFINNTAYKNGIGIYINSVKIESVVIRNNIFSQNGTPIQIGSGVPQVQITSDHNLTSGDPKFVNPAGGDFHVQAGSPAIDTGSSLNVPSSDFDGNARPRGAGYDIGAYEY